MYHGRSFFGRLLMTMLFVGLLFAVGSGIYRSGYREGFTQGVVLGAATDGGTVAPPAALYAGMMPPRGGPSLFPLLLLGFGLLFVFGRHRRRHWAHAGWESSHGRNGWASEGRAGRRPACGDWGAKRREPADEVGPEKQPEAFI